MRPKWLKELFSRRIIIATLIIAQLCFFVYVLTSSSKLSSFISALFTAISFFAVLYIVSKNDKGAYKLIWVILILSFPLFGGIFYLIFNFQTTAKLFGKMVEKIEKDTRELFHLPGSGFDEASEEMPQRIPQISYLQQFAGFPIYTGSHAQYLSSGEAKFEVLKEELEKAKNYIFLEYFIIQEGIMWDTVLDILKRKASEGVKVRIMYDDMGCFLLLPNDYAEKLNEYGIECMVFNKFRPFLSSIQNNRDHRKIISIDGKVAFTGGINLADEYINAYEKHGHWKDAAVMVKGKAAWSLTLIFLQMWELCAGSKEDFVGYYPWKDKECEQNSDGFLQPYADSPMDDENVGEHVYLQIINNAKKYVYISTPYLIIDDTMLSALTLAAKSGVDVRIVTPHKWDKWFVHITTRSYYRQLIKAGVKIYEYSKGFIHSKIFVSDDEVATVGTTNLDYRSLYLHFECGMCMYKNDAVQQVKDDIMETVSISHQITEEECKCGFVMRIVQDILRIFAPLM